MNGDITRHLTCPICGDPLDPTPGALRCPAGHSFDLARQGYVNLGTGRVIHTGDTAEMIAARDAFLQAGHFDPIGRALAEAAAPALVGEAPLIVDAGAGTGYHLGTVLDAAPGAVGLALDAAKPAVRRAARAHPRAAAALADTWSRLPVADGAASVVLNVFAPRNGAEFRRILHREGVLLVVTPASDHLAELVAALGLLQVAPDKPGRVQASLGGSFTLARTDALRWPMQLSRAEIAALVEMGPSAWHRDPHAMETQIAALPDPWTVTASVELRRYPGEGPAPQAAGPDPATGC